MNVICSLQGSFAPPHLGHKEAAFIVGQKLIELYPDSESINVMFMPTSKIASKPSLKQVSEEQRKHILDIYCSELNGSTKVNYSTSTLEYEIGPETKSTATIYTIRALKVKNPDAILVLAMGEDNGRQLPWWSNINEYSGLIDSLLFVDREPPVPSLFTSDLPYKSTYNPEKRFMRFDSGWAITLAGEKKNYTFPEIIHSPDQSIHTALKEIAIKTHLLRSPAPYSSTEVRESLASFCKNSDEAYKKLTMLCGHIVTEYLLTNKICMSGGRRKKSRKLRKFYRNRNRTRR